MKSLNAALLFLMLTSPSAVFTQSQAEKAPQSAADRAIVQAWSQGGQPSEARIEGDRLILPSDDRDNTCAFLRVYRLRRDVPGSDVTRLAGYMTCVNTSRFAMKSSVKPQQMREPSDR